MPIEQFIQPDDDSTTVAKKTVKNMFKSLTGIEQFKHLGNVFRFRREESKESKLPVRAGLWTALATIAPLTEATLREDNRFSKAAAIFDTFALIPPAVALSIIFSGVQPDMLVPDAIENIKQFWPVLLTLNMNPFKIVQDTEMIRSDHKYPEWQALTESEKLVENEHAEILKTCFTDSLQLALNGNLESDPKIRIILKHLDEEIRRMDLGKNEGREMTEAPAHFLHLVNILYQDQEKHAGNITEFERILNALRRALNISKHRALTDTVSPVLVTPDKNVRIQVSQRILDISLFTENDTIPLGRIVFDPNNGIKAVVFNPQNRENME